MNRDSDITNEILLRLLFEPFSEGDDPSGKSQQTQDNYVPNNSSGETRLGSYTPSDLADLIALEGLALDFNDSAPNAGIPHLSDPGDISAVQNHFEALLKRRLKEEIQNRPPLFPWERGYQSYPDTLGSEPGMHSIWLDHLKNLDVPNQLPDDVLATLLCQCQRVAQQTLKKGRQLVNAVEVLFPEQPQLLDQVAHLVSRPAYRSASAETVQDLDYQSAAPPQQVALSMLAAKTIFEALSLPLSATEPEINRQWLTPEGTLVVQGIYCQEPTPQIEVKVTLPAAGTVSFGTEADTVNSHRAAAGDLQVSLSYPQPGVSYPLDVALADYPSSPLQFTVFVAEG
jgi:hypothetical protein